MVELFGIHDIPTVVTSCKDENNIVPKVWKVLHDIVKCLQNRDNHVHAKFERNVKGEEEEREWLSKNAIFKSRLYNATRLLDSRLQDSDND